MLGVVLDFGAVVFATVALWYGAVWFVRGASRVARRVGVPRVVIGLTVVAFGTSAPEFAVTIEAALIGQADVSVGNVVGSNILNLGAVLGGTALVHALPTTRGFFRRDAVALVGSTLIAFLVLADLQVTRLEGVGLVVALLVYLGQLARSRSDALAADAGEFDPRDALRLVGGLVLIVVGGRLLVMGATDLARVAGVSEWVIGVTVVAAGTSTPEFVTSVVAARQGQRGISAGNVVGSCVFNVVGVLGVAALVRPLPVAGAAIDSLWWLVGFSVLVVVLFWTRSVLSRGEGGVLLGLTALNWVWDTLRPLLPV